MELLFALLALAVLFGGLMFFANTKSDRSSGPSADDRYQDGGSGTFLD